MLGAGVGGDAGVFNYPELARGIAAGYAAATNDSGHKVTETNWMMRGEAVLDYTHRSQHLMNVAARGLIAAYYGTGPHHAYFLGCSGGGRQAYKEIQRYPQDYDGVIAGAGAPAMPEMSARHLSQALYEQRNPAGAMTDASWSLVAVAAVKQCDGNDGVLDGVVENPMSCGFKPQSLQCKPGQTDACLSTEQVRTVELFYSPLRDETGKQRDLGLAPGVRTRPGPPSPLLLPMFSQGAHQDLNWRAEQFHMANDLALVDRMMPELRADDPDLSAFAARGGKAIFYQGWLDPSVVAGYSIDYFQKVQQKLGVKPTEDMARLYMVPGMLHCGGGDGVSQFGGTNDSRPIGDAQHDLLTALTQWVEEGKAPTHIIGSRIEAGKVVRERPLCPYPQQAMYRGGDQSLASSFQCSVTGEARP